MCCAKPTSARGRSRGRGERVEERRRSRSKDSGGRVAAPNRGLLSEKHAVLSRLASRENGREGGCVGPREKRGSSPSRACSPNLVLSPVAPRFPPRVGQGAAGRSRKTPLDTGLPSSFPPSCSHPRGRDPPGSSGMRRQPINASGFKTRWKIKG